MFKQYQSLPKQIEAVRFTKENKNRIFNSLAGNFYADFEGTNSILKVTTIRGETAIIRIGDWIVKGSEIGTYYPIKDKIFRQYYV